MAFDDIFQALTGHAPFPWQARLYERFAAGDMPDACDIPTGLGKTAVMAIWLAALDLRDTAPAATRLPRRLIYVVDRRAVVDQATEAAEKLREALEGRGEHLERMDDVPRAPALQALVCVKEVLGLGNRPLPVSTLRGQLADNRAWLEDPSLPAIAVATVDMIGSRLLFCGYNVSRGMRPVHAALLGTDALIVLDEAHLVPPFQALVEQVRREAEADLQRSALPARPMHLLTLSATGRSRDANAFGLGEPEAEGESVRQRLDAPKWLKIEPEVAAGKLPETLAERAWERAGDGETPAHIIVFCNSNAVARDVAALLMKKLADRFEALADKTSRPADFVELIVGARRVREREEVAKSETFRRFAHKLTEDETEAPPVMPAFIVATSAGEVGVDLDADHMVSDLVAWERMVQRLGRVNRLGQFAEGSLIDVFPSPADKKKDKEAEVAIADPDIEKWRAPFECGTWIREDDRLDVSPGALRRLREDAEFSRAAGNATTPAPLRPALRRADVDAWSMTTLREHPGRAEVEPWIRGWVEDDPQTQILWRAMLPVRDDDTPEDARRHLGDYFDAARPHVSEMLETYTWRVADLMQKRARALLKDLEKRAKEQSRPGPEDEAAAVSALPELTEQSFVALVLAHDRSVERVWRLSALAASDTKRLFRDIEGRTVVLHAALGGLDDAGLLDNRKKEVPSTIDDDRWRHPRTIEQEAADTSPWSEERLRDIGFFVRRLKRSDTQKGSWRTAYRRVVSVEQEESSEDDALEWRVERWLGPQADRNDGGLSTCPQTVAEHNRAVAKQSDEICRRLGLPDALRRAVVEAARVHDLGKARGNWQRFAGNPLFVRDPRAHPALAKSDKFGHPAMLKIGDETYRHEFGSLVDVIDGRYLDGLDADLRDLALHLVAAHHGRARPVIVPVDEKHLEETNAPVAREAALRFARLQMKWGPWGLAWLEALLRAADAAASRELNEATAASAPEGATSDRDASAAKGLGDQSRAA